MNLLRILLVAAAAWLIWRLIRQVMALQSPRPTEQDFETMQRCIDCGTHLPAAQLDAEQRCDRCRR